MNNFNVTLGKFNNSLNFVVGFTNLEDTFDSLNNPYVKLLFYQSESGDIHNGRYALRTRLNNLNGRQKYELEMCNEQLLDRIFIHG